MPNGYSASAFPTNYKDAAYDQADQSAAAAVGIPAQWLTNIRTKGEKSNANQISGANAATPYQIIPATRDAIIKQTGVDPYLSPQTAAYGAAYLLKQSLDRNGGNPILATAEYHGGTDRDAWGPKTMAYVKRVTGASPNNASATPSWGDAQARGQGAYQLQPAPTVTAAPGSGESGPSPLEQLFNAYQTGKMTPDDARAFEQDVQGGRIVLPAGMGVKAAQPTQSQPSGAQVAPPQLVDAFNSGRMSDADAIQFQHDVKNGNLVLPPGANLTPPQPATASREGGIAARGYVEGLSQAIGQYYEKGKEIANMPLNAIKAIGQGGGIVNAADQLFGTHAADLLPHAQGPSPLAGVPNVVPANSPTIPETTNYVMDRAGLPTAQTDAEKVLRAGAEGAGMLTVPVPGMALKAIPGMIAAGAAGGAVGEAVHQATGSPMLGMAANLLTTVLSPAAASRVMKVLANEVPDAAALASRVEPSLQAPAGAQAAEVAPKVGALDARAPEVAPVAAQQAAAPTRGAQQTAETGAPGVAAEAQTAPAAAQATEAAQSTGAPSSASTTASGSVNPAASPLSAAAQQFMSSEELAAQARKAVGAEGKPFGLDKQTARQVLATQGAPDAETLASAKRLGIEDNLQADHLTANQAYRELAQAIKSTPGSLARAEEMQGLQAVGQRAMQIIDAAGGSRDLSQLSSQIKGELMTTQQQLEQKAEGLYNALKQDVPSQTPAAAQNVLGFVEQRAADLGGAKNLSPIEKMIQAKLAPKEVPMTINGQQVRPSDVGMPTQYQQPTYTLLDDVRKAIGAGLRNQGPFKDADSGLLKALYANISEDQRSALSGVPGALEKFDAARAAVQMRKSVEDDLTSLFGKQLGDSVVGKLGTAMSALPKGDETKLIELLKSVPAGMRQQVTASGLAYAFGKATKNGELNFKAFADWMDGLKKNSAAFNAVMGNLPADTRTQLLDLAKVSRGISDATRESITTGRIMAAREELNAHADNMVGKVMNKAREAAVGHVGTAISAGAAHIAGPVGAGLSHAVISALSRGKPDVMKAADELIASPEFQQLAKEGTTPSAQTVKAAANSSAFRRFYDSARHATSANDPMTRQRWLMGLVGSAESASNSNTNR
ncbi:lytic transglycosylase domain-containing protein [Ralstonia insidiosa]|uniref:lytic transglycosylase domain-containing protein n=1 Tax=Ralstonia insidiosa TaxID=190721 RepID=UPI000CEF263B|nr:lytic transglycosylase domain-containing protein [Ralstonia insidiosa]